MKTTFALFLFLVACGAAKPAAPPTIVLAAGTAALHVEVAGIKSLKGHLGCALFNSSTGFPGASPIIGQGFYLPVTANDMPCDFAALPPGDYAVSVYHDENDDQALDTSIVGAPVEGYGATNNKYHATSAPSWDESRVTLGDGESLNQHIDMHY